MLEVCLKRPVNAVRHYRLYHCNFSHRAHLQTQSLKLPQVCDNTPVLMKVIFAMHNEKPPVALGKYLIVSVVAILLDQLTKWLVIKNIPAPVYDAQGYFLGATRLNVIPNFFYRKEFSDSILSVVLSSFMAVQCCKKHVFQFLQWENCKKNRLQNTKNRRFPSWLQTNRSNWLITLIKLARNSIMYLSLALHFEEKKRPNKGLYIPMDVPLKD